MPRCGEVWWVRLDPTLGSEINKTRPCLILSTNIVNDRRRTVVVVPLSTSPDPGPPLLVPVNCAGRVVADALLYGESGRRKTYRSTASLGDHAQPRVCTASAPDLPARDYALVERLHRTTSQPHPRPVSYTHLTLPTNRE